MTPKPRKAPPKGKNKEPVKLSRKQLMFCLEYIKDLNAAAAAVRSGYSAKTANRIGSENLTKLDIQQEVQRLMNKRAQKAELSAESVLNDIIEIKDRCMQKVPVMRFDKVEKRMVQVTDFDENDKEVGVWTFDANGAIRSCELLGKHLKLFTDKVELSGEVNLITVKPPVFDKEE